MLGQRVIKGEAIGQRELDIMSCLQ